MKGAAVVRTPASIPQTSKGVIGVLTQHDHSEGDLTSTVSRITKEAAHSHLPAIYQAISKAREMKRIAAVAESAGDEETADAIRLALRGLAKEAAV